MNDKKCDRCKIKLGYIDFINHKCYTVKEWKQFRKFTGDFIDGNELTMQEILIDKYQVILIDHRTRRSAGKMCPTPFKEQLIKGLKNLPSKINQKNLDKGLATFDKGMKEFDKQMASFGSSMAHAESDINKRGKQQSSKVAERNVQKLWGNKKKKNTPIWGITKEKPKKRKKRKSKSDNWDQDESNLEKLWGKKK